MTRPLRSWMFVPGNRQRFLDKALDATSEADALLLDLEDGVVPDDKDTARAMVAEALARPAGGPLRAVRVNAVDTPWLADDLEAIVGPGLEAVCLPKAESADDVRAVAAVLERWDPRRRIGIVAAIESAGALLRAHEIASADARVLALMFGGEDLALDLGLGTARVGEAAELLYPRSALVVAAAAARVLSIDGVFPDLDDEDGLLADVLQARRLGFGAKSTFNPRQVRVINERFRPAADEVHYARRVVDAFDEAAARGDASVAVGGQLVDRPIVLRARRTLQLAERLGVRSGEEQS